MEESCFANGGPASINSQMPGGVAEMTHSVPGGWIYILWTNSDLRRVKIGMSINNPVLRLATLRCGDPFLGMIGAFFIPASLGELGWVEREVHRWVADRRIRFQAHLRSVDGVPAHLQEDLGLNGLSEWFWIHMGKAESEVRNALQYCLGADQIATSAEYHSSARPESLAFYTQEMLTQMFGKITDIDDDRALAQYLDGRTF